MSRSQESYGKKDVRKKKERKRKEKEARRLARKENKGSMDDMIAYVDEFGNITSTPPDPTKKKAEIKLEDIQLGAANSGSNTKTPTVRTGRVAFFNDEKGYGFINDLDTRESVFVHINNTLDDIVKGDLVNFEMEMGPKGPVAMQVKVIK